MAGCTADVYGLLIDLMIVQHFSNPRVSRAEPDKSRQKKEKNRVQIRGKTVLGLYGYLGFGGFKYTGTSTTLVLQRLCTTKFCARAREFPPPCPPAEGSDSKSQSSKGLFTRGVQTPKTPEPYTGVTSSWSLLRRGACSLNTSEPYTLWP